MPNHGVAITVPEPWATTLQQAREDFGDPMASAIPPHVTLLPPTAVGDDTMPTFLDHLQVVTAAAEPFDMVLSGTGTFRPVSPVVFVQVSQGIPYCEALERAVRSGPVERTLDFPYHPHVTVAHDLPDDVLTKAFDEMASYDVRFEVWGFSLYEHGPDEVWRPQRDFPLGQLLPGPQSV
jgi:2'-5' RNA ligase